MLTNSVKFVSNRSSFLNRFFDILGGLAGCFFTGIIFLFVAPMIYIKSLKPIF